MNEEGGEDDSHTAECICKNMKENTMHVVILVMSERGDYQRDDDDRDDRDDDDRDGRDHNGRDDRDDRDDHNGHDHDCDYVHDRDRDQHD